MMKTKTNYNKMITKYKLFESKKDVFEIGTKVICSDGIQDGARMDGAYGHITDIDEDANVCEIRFEYWPDSNGRGTWWVCMELIHLYDENFEKKRREKIERLRLKYKHVDPYGEEDWEEEEED